jgi:hypothetical protein
MRLLAGTHLPPLDEADPTKSALRRCVEEAYDGEGLDIAARYGLEHGR